MRVGMVSIVGRPNVGKSTLLNSILDVKLAITSDKVGTTRHVIDGIYNDSDSQIVFVDTPGIAKPLKKLDSVLNKKSYSSMDTVDVVLFLVDASTGIGRGDEFILSKLDKDVPTFLILNKIDKLDKDKLLKEIDHAKDLFPFKEIIPVSALKKDNLKDLLHTIKKYLSDGEKIFSEDELTNITSRFYASEKVREKILMLTHNEVPHTVTCYTEKFEEEDNIINISVLVVVERDNLKKIIIGKGGSFLKKVGTLARNDLEEFFGKKVYLETYVKTMKNWRDEEKYLIELGIDE